MQQAPAPAEAAASPPHLAEDVYLAWSNGAAIFLDLGADRYFGLDPVQSALLRDLLEEAGTRAPPDRATDRPTDRPTDGPRDARLDALRARLTRAGLLAAQVTTHATTPPHRVSAPAPRRAVVRAGREAGLSTLFDLCVAARLAQSEHARLSLRSLVAAQRARRTRLGVSATDEARARATAGAFLAARRWIRHRDACLVEALTLLHVLERRGMAAFWVFGVHAAPFEAHCWLQHGDLVLNDSLDHVARYTPILAA